MISTQYVLSPECFSQINFFLFYRFHTVLPTTDPGYKPCTVIMDRSGKSFTMDQCGVWLVHFMSVTKRSSQSPSPSPEPMAHPSDVQEPAGNVSDRVQQFNPPAEPTPQTLMPDEIRLDMQNLMERQIVHEVLQGPAEEIDRAL